MKHLVPMALASSLLLGLAQAQLSAGQTMVQPEQVPKDALTMNSWAALKTTMDSIGGEVQEVLSVSNDMAMLQEDLLKQENTWHKAKEDLQSQVDSIQAKAQRVQEMATAGADVHHRVAALKASIEKEKVWANAATKLFEYEGQQAAMAVARLPSRIDELRRRFAEVKASGQLRLQEARAAALNTTNETARLERDATRLSERVRDEKQALRLEQIMEKDKAHDILNRMAGMRTTMTTLRGQLLSPGQMENQLDAIKAQVELETKAIAGVQTARLQQKADCDARQSQTLDAMTAEQAKAAKRKSEMQTVCDAAMQRKTLLESIATEACAGVPPAPLPESAQL